jgi:hypothetical protein
MWKSMASGLDFPSTPLLDSLVVYFFAINGEICTIPAKKAFFCWQVSKIHHVNYDTSWAYRQEKYAFWDFFMG